MAGDDMSSRIINLFQARNNECMQLADISSQLSVHKKQINVELYRLKRQGFIKKVQESPPVWQLSPANFETQSSHYYPLKSKRYGDVSKKGKEKKFTGLKHGIAFGGSRNKKARVSKELMQQIVLVLQQNKTPIKTIDIAKEVGKNTSSEVNPTLYLLEKQGVVLRATVQPVTWIINADYEHKQQLVDSNVTLTNQRDVLLSMNSGIADESDDETDDTINYSKVAEHGSGIPSMNMLDLNLGITNQNSPNIDIENLNVSSPNHETNFFSEELGFDNASYSFGPLSEVDIHFSDQNLETEMEIGDAGNQNIDFDEQEVECFSESASPILGQGYSHQISKSEAGLQENRAECSFTEFSGNINSDSKPDSLVISSETSGTNLNSYNQEGEPETFSDSDEVLRTLLHCPMQTAKLFILETKTKIPKEKLESILEKCKKDKIVKFQEPLWVMTQEGVEYINKKLSKLGQGTGIKSVSSSLPASKPSKTVFKGPPPPPSELIKKENSADPTTYTNVNFSIQQPNFHSLSSSYITSSQRPSSGPVVNPVLQNKGGTSFPGSYQSHGNSSAPNPGPVPLMSLDLKPPNFVQGAMSPLNRLLNASSRVTTSSQSQNTGITVLNSVKDQKYKLDVSSSSTPSNTFNQQTENLPAFFQQIQNSFSSASKSQDSRLQPRSGVSQATLGRFPLSRMQTPAVSSKSSSVSSGFKPPPSPLDIVRQQSVNTAGTNSGSSQVSLSEAFSRPVCTGPFSGQQVGGNRLSGQPQSLPVMSNTPQIRQISGPSSLDLTAESFAAVNKNPVSALMEYAQSRHKVARIEVINQSGPSHRPKFMMGVFIGDQQIASVMCSNKKDGRREVADKALRALIASGQYNVQAAPAAKPLVPAANMTHFDKIAALSHQAFNTLVAGIAENFAGRKVIAALVMKCSDTDVGTVVSVGSGNRCITGQQLSLEGNTVNDSHAEIITRRGFIRFLYKRLLAYDPNKPDIFEKAPSGKLRLRNGITLHLYISTAPCGDGALFSPRDASSNSGPMLNINDRTHRPTFTTQAQGLVRTKMEGGEGTIPVEKDFTHQTFDGIQRGERLRTMSCTDKICRWNVVGMQGALLSHFLEPIYLDSLTLGLLYDHGHLARALCCRVARGDNNIDEILPNGYHLNHPWLGRVTACEPPREVQKTKALSINWCIGDEKAEVCDGTQGLLYTKIEKGLFSRCSKKNLYDSFKKLCQKYGSHHLLQAKTYHEAKQMASDFQHAKEALLSKFKENGCGIWVSKPIEEELFN